MTPIELSWIAGYCDGEGTIGVQRQIKNAKNTFYHARISIANTDKKTMVWLKNKLGGHFYIYVHHTKKGKNFYRWEVWGKNAGKFAKKIMPYLRSKKEQAKLLIKFQERVNNNYWKHLSKTEVRVRERLYWKISGLNNMVNGKEGQYNLNRRNSLNQKFVEMRKK